MEIDFSFDYDHLKAMLLEAARAAFVDIRQKFQGENFYIFGFFTSDNQGYMLPVANTEEALTRKAEKYVLDSRRYGGLNVHEMRLWLRNSPGDFTTFFDDELLTRFEKINALLAERANRQSEIYMEQEFESGDDDNIFENHDSAFDDVCLRVLRQLAEEGIFKVGSDSQKPVIILYHGHQSHKISLIYAQQLNSTAIYQHYQNELRLIEELYHRISKTRKD